MPHLKLCRCEDAGECDSLPFPNIRESRCACAPEVDETLDDQSVDQTIEAALARIERSLQNLQDELDDVYHLPSPDDWRPTAA